MFPPTGQRASALDRAVAICWSCHADERERRVGRVGLAERAKHDTWGSGYRLQFSRGDGRLVARIYLDATTKDAESGSMVSSAARDDRRRRAPVPGSNERARYRTPSNCGPTRYRYRDVAQEEKKKVSRSVVAVGCAATRSLADISILRSKSWRTMIWFRPYYPAHSSRILSFQSLDKTGASEVRQARGAIQPGGEAARAHDTCRLAMPGLLAQSVSLRLRPPPVDVGTHLSCAILSFFFLFRRPPDRVTFFFLA